jgi:hypothetical protein
MVWLQPDHRRVPALNWLLRLARLGVHLTTSRPSLTKQQQVNLVRGGHGL